MRLSSYIILEGKKTTIKLPDEYFQKETKMAELIHANCKPFINQIKGSKKFLYRGVKTQYQMIEVVPRKMRKPKDMDPDHSKILDSLFNKKFGWKPRSQGVFASGEIGRAMVYGYPHTVWPIGKFSYLWSPDLVQGDLYIQIKKLIEYEWKVADPLVNLGKEEMVERLTPKFRIIVNSYKQSELKKALMLDTEIMIGCKSYYLISDEFSSSLRSEFLE